MSPSLPPTGLPVDTVLVPYAFCVAVPNLVASKFEQLIFSPVNTAVDGFHVRCPSSVSIYCLLYHAVFCAENVI